MNRIVPIQEEEQNESVDSNDSPTTFDHEFLKSKTRTFSNQEGLNLQFMDAICVLFDLNINLFFGTLK
jgi:hypothetical protein